MQRCLDLTELDAEATDLDLLSRRPRNWMLPSGCERPKSPVRNTLRPPSGIEWIGNEPFGRAHRIIVIAPRKPGASDEQFAGNSRSDRL